MPGIFGKKQEEERRLEAAEAELAAAQQELAAALREAAALRAVLARVDTAILAVDREHHRLFANPAAVKLWALGDEPAARATSLARLPELVAGLEEVSAQGGAWRRRLPLPDERSLEVTITALDAEGACVILARDVSESVRLETVRRDFVAALSHELRTPLTSIQGYAEMLRRQPELDPAMRAEFLDIMSDNVGRLSRLAADLVLLSSLETGAYPFRFEGLEAAALAPPAVAAMAPLAEELQAQVGAAGFEAGAIRGDRDALHRVLLNLIENAIVHGAGGERKESEARLRVELSGRQEADQYVLRVRDNGPGISSADQPRVFERFYQVGGHASGAARRRQRGAGLGLAVVKHVVREHGGEVAVESALGEGSTFLVKLPMARLAPPLLGGLRPAPPAGRLPLVSEARPRGEQGVRSLFPGNLSRPGLGPAPRPAAPLSRERFGHWGEQNGSNS